MLSHDVEVHLTLDRFQCVLSVTTELARVTMVRERHAYPPYGKMVLTATVYDYPENTHHTFVMNLE